MKSDYKNLIDRNCDNILIVFKSLLVGSLVSVIVILYRVILTYGEEFAFGIYDFLRNNLALIPVAIIALAIVGYFVGWMVQKNKMISGSGIPQLEGILKGHFIDRKGWLHTLLSKFIGGTIAIGAGLSLGREGPSIQLGACVAEGVGEKIGNGRLERKILMAGGASAGLAAAFNAPMAGVIFALEEIFKYFSPIILLSMLSASVAADFISKQVFGLEPIFNFEIIKDIPLNSYWLLILLGVVLGLLGAIYNFVLLKTKKIYERAKFLNTKTRVVIPFVISGIIGLLFPVILCGGHEMIQELTLSNSIGFIMLLYLAKFLFSMICFGSGAPGGIFFPLIILGGTAGAVFGSVLINYFGFDPELFNNFIVLAMAGYFTAIVRAPITGIVLILEMTGSFNHILPLTVVAVTAYVVADIIKSPPIYEALLENMIQKEEGNQENESIKKIVVELIVQHGSQFENTQVKDIVWPGKSLLVGVKQGEKQIIPKGDTEIKGGDFLSILTDVNSESKIKEILYHMNESKKQQG